MGPLPVARKDHPLTGLAPLQSLRSTRTDAPHESAHRRPLLTAILPKQEAPPRSRPAIRPGWRLSWGLAPYSAIRSASPFRGCRRCRTTDCGFTRPAAFPPSAFLTLVTVFSSLSAVGLFHPIQHLWDSVALQSLPLAHSRGAFRHSLPSCRCTVRVRRSPSGPCSMCESVGDHRCFHRDGRLAALLSFIPFRVRRPCRDAAFTTSPLQSQDDAGCPRASWQPGGASQPALRLSGKPRARSARLLPLRVSASKHLDGHSLEDRRPSWGFWPSDRDHTRWS
jgi:hypothetical protein